MAWIRYSLCYGESYRYLPLNNKVDKDAQELASLCERQPLIRLRIVGTTGQPGNEVDDSLLVPGTPRLQPREVQYFVIGEVKGAEAKYFINAADTGHRCWCSVHAPSALDAIDKLADYVTYESKYSKTEASFMLKDLGTVIFMKDFQVCEIAELSGWDKEKETLKYTPVYLRPGMPHTAFEDM